MKYSAYQNVQSTRNLKTFRFASEGPYGEISKVVQFTATGVAGFYNLAFGDWKEKGFLDDQVMTDNGDRDKVIATVAMTVYAFTERYPRRTVIFQGSTPARTRLYRMAITHAWNELDEIFEIHGLLKDDAGELRVRPFEPGKDFQAFLVKRKQVLELPNPPP